MKPYKKTRQAWEMTCDMKPKGELKKIITRIERRKLKEEAKKEIKEITNNKV